MPSDHLIPDNTKFSKQIKIIKSLLQPNQWITLGIKPTKPSEAYGYIQVEKNDNDLYKVTKFIEKPSEKKALQFIKQGNYYWNSGIFIAKARKIISSVKKYAPTIATNCDINFTKMSTNLRTNEINFSTNLFSKIPSKSIDYAVMEKERDIVLYPFKSIWNDVGSWDSYFTNL